MNRWNNKSSVPLWVRGAVDKGGAMEIVGSVTIAFVVGVFFLLMIFVGTPDFGLRYGFYLIGVWVFLTILTGVLGASFGSWGRARRWLKREWRVATGCRYTTSVDVHQILTDLADRVHSGEIKPDVFYRARDAAAGLDRCDAGLNIKACRSIPSIATR